MHVTLADFPATAPAGTLVVAWADAGPSSEMVGAVENAHVGSQFGDHHCSQDPADTGDLCQSRARPLVGLELLVNFLLDLSQVGVYLLQAAHLEAEQEAMVFLYLPFEGSGEIGSLVTQAPLGELCHLHGRGRT